VNYLLLIFFMATFSVAEPFAQPIGAPGDDLFTLADLVSQQASQPQFIWYLDDAGLALCYYPPTDPAYDVCSSKASTWNPPAWPLSDGDPRQPGQAPTSVPEPAYAYLIVLPGAIARPQSREALRRAIRAALARIKRDVNGQDILEYALLAGFIAVACGAILPSVANSVSQIFSQINSTMVSAGTIPGGQ
jgi:Flp pilus assembly pilin Flp